MTDTNLSAIDIAKLSAVLEGGGHKRSKNKAAALAKLDRLLADKFSGSVLFEVRSKIYSAADLDEARAALFAALNGGQQTSAPGNDEAPPARPTANQQQLTNEAATNEAATNEAEEPKAKAKRAPRGQFAGKRLSIVGGKEASNPYRAGTRSAEAFAMVQNEPGITYEDFLARGGRARTILEEAKAGRLRAK